MPEASIVAALAHAGIRPEAGSQSEKRRWSERFAHTCALAFADELRRLPALQGKGITPTAIGQGSEKLVPLGAGTSKRIDVTVVDRVLGLEIGLSLKGLNFRDSNGDQFDKNLTGRMYEMSDEMRLVHEYLPRAFMVGVFFLPLDSTVDKTERADSSFARAVLALRERTGRLDPSLGGQASRCDAAYVALYATGSEPQGYPSGVTRLMNVQSDPPRRGRPKVSETLSIEAVVQQIVSQATFSAATSWGEAERRPALDLTEPRARCVPVAPAWSHAHPPAASRSSVECWTSAGATQSSRSPIGDSSSRPGYATASTTGSLPCAGALTSRSRGGGSRCSSTAASGTPARCMQRCPRRIGSGGAKSCRPMSPATVTRTKS